MLDLRGASLSADGLAPLTVVLVRVEPEALILSTGSADGACGIVDLTHPDRMLTSIEHVLRTLDAALPGTCLVLQALPPADARHAPAIEALNDALEGLCATLGVGFLPLHPHFAQLDGSMNPDLVSSSGQLNRDGFETWIEMLDLAALLPETVRPRRLPVPRHIYRPPGVSGVRPEPTFG
ncbi:hypothetical protein [Plantibacter sp. ME-Dv--P-122b]|uniref:hypothetical protein n=1 Tax=Plantibacter sp. ME-Dv--P-122b TaxID=3040300 RepID=UPI00254EA38F|nr:hypothetical protein [Plantibacter sp. ME-Dv--P-122b]